MKLTKTSSVEELQVLSRFESLRKILLSDTYAHHLDKPLAYWALPTDRRLPLALLGRTLRDLLGTPFNELSATPGIGQKKICSFVKLRPGGQHHPPSCPPTWRIFARWPRAPATAITPTAMGSSGQRVRSGLVAVAGDGGKTRAGQGNLGPACPQPPAHDAGDLMAPLSDYTDRTLSEIRTMKTHGEKRVRAILEVFHSVHAW